MTDLINPYYCKCPHCGYEMDEEEAEQVCDDGCSFCRCSFDVEDQLIEF